jgi:hypothetical protein
LLENIKVARKEFGGEKKSGVLPDLSCDAWMTPGEMLRVGTGVESTNTFTCESMHAMSMPPHASEQPVDTSGAARSAAATAV